LSALVLVGLVLAALLPAGVAQADVTDDRVLATVGFDQAYLGRAQFDGVGGAPVLDDGNRATLGLFGRLEVALPALLSIGAEGAFRWYRTEGDAVIGDDFGRLADANGFLRLFFPLNDGQGEYYLLAGAGASWLVDDGRGQGARVDDALGWNLFARAGVRGELVDGFGGILEVGWVRRQFGEAFERDDGGAGGPQTFGFVTNQLTVVIGWYLAL
ncbi:MAG TPA: hypothetical protein RMF84_01460, partial [Polyangiaceae bacterium LLY-WYZ-14_1]|nr:hypothetical protein [Polyangiaceae bacterium LLY-WYZ-14_1]